MAYSFMAILVVTMVSAGLVNYLSDSITGEVNVTSPIELSGDITSPLDVFAGSDPVVRNIRFTNLANADIITHAEFTITAPSDWSETLEEFNTLELVDVTNNFDCGSIKSFCSADSEYPRILNCVLLEATIPAESSIDYELTAGFNQAATPGDYSFTIQAMN